MALDFGSVNWLAVVVSAVATFFIGGVWYGAVFAKAWVSVHGFKEDELAVMQKQQMRNFGIFILGDLVMATVISLMFTKLGITTAMQGALIGALIWLGISATLGAARNAAYSKTISAFLIDTCHELVCLAAMGAIIGGWS